MMEHDKPRQIVVPMDEDEEVNIFVWLNSSRTLYELKLMAIDNEVFHSFEKMEKLGEED